MTRMKKRWLGILAAVVFLLRAGMPVYAEHYNGGAGWAGRFTGTDMESSFRTADINDAIYNLQPGNSIDLTLTLQNSGTTDTDWWMKNKVLRSLEDTQKAAAGGGYSYILIWQNPLGQQEMLYSSDTVGGEKNTAAVEGLHEATNSTQEYFFLDTMRPGEQGYILLTVALDGETQGNVCQDTLADLEMNFAAEETAAPSVIPNESAQNRVKSDVPRTGDENRLLFFGLLTVISGMLLLALCICGRAESRRESSKASGKQEDCTNGRTGRRGGMRS